MRTLSMYVLFCYSMYVYIYISKQMTSVSGATGKYQYYHLEVYSRHVKLSRCLEYGAIMLVHIQAPTVECSDSLRFTSHGVSHKA